MNDRELLEQAAKAAGYNQKTEPAYWLNWNPLTDDGDALRLAVKLSMEIYIHEEETRCVCPDLQSAFEWHDDDPYAATRRAIVRTAAEIGKGMV